MDCRARSPRLNRWWHRHARAFLAAFVAASSLTLVNTAYAGTGTTTAVPNADGTTAGWTAGGSATGCLSSAKWACVDDDPDSVDSTNYVDGPNVSDVNNTMFVQLGDMPANFVSATAVEIKIAHAEEGSGNDTVGAAYQIYQSNESTAITAEAPTTTVTQGSVSTRTESVAVTGTNDKTTWNGARLRFRSNWTRVSSTDVTSRLRVYAAEVNITYTSIDSTFEQSTYRWFENGGSGAGGWWNADWLARRKITFANSAATENLTNFPVLVRLTSSKVDYGKTQSSGQDLRFIDSDGTELDYEIETWDESGESLVWVKIPQLDDSDSDYIWMYYDNSAATAGQDAAGTWSNGYAAVWHFKEDPAATAPQMADSTSNANNGTTVGMVAATSTTGGKVGKALNYDKINDQISVGNPASLSGLQANGTTLSAWMKPVSGGEHSTIGGFLFGKQANSANDELSLSLNDGADNLRFKSGRAGSVYGEWTSPTNSVTYNSWHHVALAYDGSSNANDPVMYLNGSSQTVTETAAPSGSLPASDNLWLGAEHNGAYTFDGVLDEMRISNVVRSSSWVRAEHANIDNTATFNTVGAEETRDQTTWWNTSWLSRRKVTFANAAVTENLTDFPVLVRLTSSNIDYAKTQNSGQDIRFVDGDGAELEYEIETWNESGESLVWVKVPQLDDSNVDHVWMYYNNTSASDAQDAASVWSNGFLGVWHLKQDPSGTAPQITDRGPNGIHGTTGGSMTAGQQVAGKINGSLDFDGVDDTVSLGDVDALDTATALTACAWVNHDTLTADHKFIAKTDTANNGFQLFRDDVGSVSGRTDEYTWAIDDFSDTDQARIESATNSSVSATWTHVCGTYQASSATGARLYVNGIEDANSPASTSSIANINAAAEVARIGSGRAVGDPFDGKIDEVRLSTTVRSSSWVRAEYENSHNTATFNTVGSEQNWYNASWTARRKITLDNSASAENLANFPVLVTLDSSNINYSKTQNAGQDVRFTDSDGTTLLKYEIEKWDEAGTSAVWVKVPQIDSGSTTDHIYLYYDNDSAADAQDPANVWDTNYKGVWHLKENPAASAPQLTDSTTNANNGTTGGSMTSADSVAGKVGSAVELDGTDDQASIGDKASLEFTGTTATLSFSSWVRLDAAPSESVAIFSKYKSSGDERDYFFGIDSSGKPLTAVYPGTNAGNFVHTDTTVLNVGEWYHIASTVDVGNDVIKTYVNGNLSTTSASGAITQMNATAAVAYIGAAHVSATSPDLFFPGDVDELRVSSSLRSADWTEAAYKSMNGSMASYGSEQTPGTVEPLAATNTAFTQTSLGQLRLRMALHIGTDPLPASSGNFKLQFSPKSGTCDAAFSGESYDDVATGSGAVRYYDNGGLTDGSAMTPTPDDPTHSGHTNVGQTYEEANNFTNTSSISAGADGLWEFALDTSNAPGNTSYCFRAINADGSTLNTYTVFPELTTPAVTLEQSAYRWYDAVTTNPLAATNTAATAPAQGTAFRLRLTQHVDAVPLTSGAQSFKLQFAARSGTCDIAFSGESYNDVATGSGAIRYHNDTPADGSALSASGSDPTHGSHTVVVQTYEEANNFTSTSTVGVGQDGLWEFSLVDFSAPGSTAYCFRIVKSDDAPLTTYSVIPQITTAASGANTAPNTPDSSSLVQMKTDDTVVATGGWINATSVKFSATASDPDASDMLYLCVERKTIGTAFANTDTYCETAPRAYTGTPVTLTVSLSSQSDDTESHWQVRVKDAAGAYSGWVSYGGNLETARDYGMDTSAPTGGTVYDGTSTGVDASFNDGSLSSLSANWSGFSAAVSGLQKYQYSIGTAAGGTTVKAWTDAGRHASLPGTSGNYVSTPDSATNSVTGDIDLRVKVTPDSWTPGTPQVLIGKRGPTGHAFAYRIDTSGEISFFWWDSSGSLMPGLGYLPSPAFVAGDTEWLRLTLQVNNGSGQHVIRHYESDDGITWTQKASATRAGTTSIRDVSADLAVGAYPGQPEHFDGLIHYAEMRNGINGSVVAKMDPNEAASASATSWTSSSPSAESWTVNQSGSPNAFLEDTPFITATGLTLQTGQRYYFNVRAVDNAGNTQSPVISSNGQLVAPTLTFSVSPSSVSFARLNAGNSYTDTQSVTITTSTNGYGGYVIRAFANGVLSGAGSKTLGMFNGGTYASPDIYQGSDTGFGYTSSDTSVQGSNKFQPATCAGGGVMVAPGCFVPFSTAGPGDIVADHASGITGTPVTNEAFTISYRVKASALQKAGSYATTVGYTATVVY